MSASRVETDDDMVVDDSGVAPPTSEWMQAAQRAADINGILENEPAKRQKVCNSCCTPTTLHLQNLAHKCTQRRESLPKVRVRVARTCKKKREKEHPKRLLGPTSALPPKTL